MERAKCGYDGQQTHGQEREGKGREDKRGGKGTHVETVRTGGLLGEVGGWVRTTEGDAGKSGNVRNARQSTRRGDSKTI